MVLIQSDLNWIWKPRDSVRCACPMGPVTFIEKMVSEKVLSPSIRSRRKTVSRRAWYVWPDNATVMSFLWTVGEKIA
jgi:hypothetical protein